MLVVLFPVTTRGRCDTCIFFSLHSDPTLGLEAQQRYSTGYIQCMHEVHNMLLTCDWMDKTLGSRLLNHLLKSLPRSTDERSLTLPTPRLDAALPATQAVPGTPLRVEQFQRDAGPQERPALHSSHLGMLEMWRPWWTAGLMILVVHSVRPSSVMYLIDMLLRRQTWGGFCSSDYYCRCAIMILYRPFLSTSLQKLTSCSLHYRRLLLIFRVFIVLTALFIVIIRHDFAS